MRGRLGILLTAALSMFFVLPVSQQRWATLLAQSSSPTPPPATFHIQGTIDSPFNSNAYPRVGRSEVSFQSEHFDKRVAVDEKGLYQIDLPLGFYKMSVTGPTVNGMGLLPHARVFRVRGPGTIVLNAALQFAQLTCDAVGGIEERRDACGGEDVVTIPAQDGTPFELSIRYPQRQIERYGLLYKGSDKSPIYLTYNLLSLRASQVSYLEKRREILAYGDVVIEDGSGKKQHFENIHLMFQDGVAAQFREDLPRPLQYDHQ